MWSPRQVTHVPPVWDILLPLAYTPDRRNQRLSVYHPKYTAGIQSLMLRARFLHLKYNMPVPGIKPRSPACQVGVLTTNTAAPLLGNTLFTLALGWEYEGCAFGSVCLSMRVTQKLLLRLT